VTISNQDLGSQDAQARNVGTALRAHDDDTCVGTATFLLHTIVGTCRHCLILDDDVKYYLDYFYLELPDQTLHRFEHIASYPLIDLALLRVNFKEEKQHDFFPFASFSSLAVAQEIWSIGFPQMVDFEHQGKAGHELTTTQLRAPATCTHGQIACAVSYDFLLGDYAGFPNSSGAAVTTRFGDLVGIHSEGVYHSERNDAETPLLLDVFEGPAIAVLGPMASVELAASSESQPPETTEATKQRLKRHSIVIADQSVHIEKLVCDVGQKGSLSSFISSVAIQKKMVECQLLVSSGPPNMCRVQTSRGQKRKP
jgi:hypothetical protein